MLCQTSILLPSSTLVSSRGRELKKILQLPSPWHPAWRKRCIRNEDRTVTARVWNKLVQTLTCMEMLLVSVWTCGCVTEPHFIPMPEVLLECELWPYFPGYSRVKLQSKKTPSAPHFVQFIYPFFRTEVGLSFDMISAMRVWVSGGGGISWLTVGLSFLFRSIIAMNTVQLPFPSLMKQYVSRKFMFFHRCCTHTHTCTQQYPTLSSLLVILLFSQITFQCCQNNGSSPRDAGCIFHSCELWGVSK